MDSVKNQIELPEMRGFKSWVEFFDLARSFDNKVDIKNNVQQWSNFLHRTAAEPCDKDIEIHNEDVNMAMPIDNRGVSFYQFEGSDGSVLKAHREFISNRLRNAVSKAMNVSNNKAKRMLVNTFKQGDIEQLLSQVGGEPNVCAVVKKQIEFLCDDINCDARRNGYTSCCHFEQNGRNHYCFMFRHTIPVSWVSGVAFCTSKHIQFVVCPFMLEAAGELLREPGWFDDEWDVPNDCGDFTTTALHGLTEAIDDSFDDVCNGFTEEMSFLLNLLMLRYHISSCHIDGRELEAWERIMLCQVRDLGHFWSADKDFRDILQEVPDGVIICGGISKRQPIGDAIDLSDYWDDLRHILSDRLRNPLPQNGVGLCAASGSVVVRIERLGSSEVALELCDLLTSDNDVARQVVQFFNSHLHTNDNNNDGDTSITSCVVQVPGRSDGLRAVRLPSNRVSTVAFVCAFAVDGLDEGHHRRWSQMVTNMYRSLDVLVHFDAYNRGEDAAPHLSLWYINETRSMNITSAIAGGHRQRVYLNDQGKVAGRVAKRIANACSRVAMGWLKFGSKENNAVKGDVVVNADNDSSVRLILMCSALSAFRLAIHHTHVMLKSFGKPSKCELCLRVSNINSKDAYAQRISK